jgi:hypothetical protein
MFFEAWVLSCCYAVESFSEGREPRIKPASSRAAAVSLHNIHGAEQQVHEMPVEGAARERERPLSAAAATPATGDMQWNRLPDPPKP